MMKITKICFDVYHILKVSIASIDIIIYLYYKIVKNPYTSLTDKHLKMFRDHPRFILICFFDISALA